MEIDQMTKAIKKDLMKNSKGELAEKLIFAYHSLEKAEKTLAEAKKEGAREILNKALRFECKEKDCSNCLEENDIVCAINGIVRTYGVDEVIKKVEGV